MTPPKTARGKSSHAAKHFCSIDQAAAMGEEAVRIAKADRIEAQAALVQAFEGRIAGLEVRITALEAPAWYVRAWRWVAARVGGWFRTTPIETARVVTSPRHPEVMP